MNGIDLGRGRSFKGLANYLLHDAKEEEGQHLTTTERVGWTQSLNLNGASADKAWRLMVATATSADALKQAAGGKKVGAKNTKPVFHYSISWPDEDKPSPDLQKKAVAESLKALGLAEHQALAVQHLDGKPHVHVMVNLINPENGTTPKLSYTHKKLRTWANKFEQTHGLQICKTSHNNIERRRNGERVDAQRKPRNVYEQEKREGQSRRLQWLRNRENKADHGLGEKHRTKIKNLDEELAGITTSYQAQRDALEVDKDTAIIEAKADVKTNFKPKWAAMYANNRARMKQFENSEKSAFLQVFTATTTFMEARKSGKGILKSLAAAGNQAERRALIEKWNKLDEERVFRELGREVSAAIKQVKEGYDVQLTGARAAYLEQSGELKQQKKAAIAVQREQWKERKTRRASGFRQVTGQKINHSQLLEQNEGLRQYIGRRLEPK